MDFNFLFSDTSLILIGGGFLIGIYSVVIGGGMFFSAPLIQYLFPGASFGAIVGNQKVGSLFRGLGSTQATKSKIKFWDNLKASVPLLFGSIVGASIIASLDQKWLFPAIIVAVILAELAPKITQFITPKTFLISAFLIGLYAGFFGAGLGILLVALMRLKFPNDSDIALVKIQARFVEFLLVFVAVGTHYFHGNLMVEIWLPWSLGSLVGGLVGGWLLHHIHRLSGDKQKAILRFSFVVALVVAGMKFFA